MADAKTARSAALGVLRAGRVCVVWAHGDRASPPYEVMAVVAPSAPGRPTYVVDLMPDVGWCCTCPRWFGATPRGCKHVAAVCMITGYPTPARLEE